MNSHPHSQTIFAGNRVQVARRAGAGAAAEVFPIAPATPSSRAAGTMQVIPRRGSDTRSYKLIGDVHLLLLDRHDLKQVPDDP